VTTPTVTETQRAGQTNEPVELARYTRHRRRESDPGTARPRRREARRHSNLRRGPPLRHRARADDDGRTRRDRHRLPRAGSALGRHPGHRLVSAAGRAPGGRAMIERHRPDPTERDELTEEDLAIATLVGRYVERREAGQPAFPARPARHRCRVRRHGRRQPADRARLLRGDAHQRRPHNLTDVQPTTPGGLPCRA
jgi:hypothetical protein